MHTWCTYMYVSKIFIQVNKCKFDCGGERRISLPCGCPQLTLDSWLKFSFSLSLSSYVDCRPMPLDPTRSSLCIHINPLLHFQLSDIFFHCGLPFTFLNMPFDPKVFLLLMLPILCIVLSLLLLILCPRNHC